MNEAAIVVNVGKRGSGKTTNLRELADRSRRLILIDPEKKWDPDPRDVVVEGAAALYGALRAADALDPAAAFRLVYRDRAELMDLAGCGAAFVTRNLTLAIDEIAWLCHAHYLPPQLKQLLQFGRERRVNLLLTTREPQEIHNLFFSQADLLQFFHMDPGNGLKRVQADYPQIAAELPGLAVGNYRIYGDAGITAHFGQEGLDSQGPRAVRSKRRSRRRRTASPG